jgi:hypothetical protein
LGRSDGVEIDLVLRKHGEVVLPKKLAHLFSYQLVTRMDLLLTPGLRVTSAHQKKHLLWNQHEGNEEAEHFEAARMSPKEAFSRVGL